MNIVKELNNLSEKVTGTNPKAKIDAEAVKYIADNYSGGGSDAVLLTLEGAEYGQLTDETLVSQLNSIRETFDESGKVNCLIKLIEDGNTYIFNPKDIEKYTSGGTTYYQINFPSISVGDLYIVGNAQEETYVWYLDHES